MEFHSELPSGQMEKERVSRFIVSKRKSTPASPGIPFPDSEI